MEVTYIHVPSVCVVCTYNCVCLSLQIAELTKTWAGKWDGIQSVLEVHACGYMYIHVCVILCRATRLL